ncbi:MULTISPECIES: putative entry exclusion protein TrbK-alt [unclassified Afipia]|jgi:conjugative transfer region protein TrbK|uniref:putative entry exclusion protein TrbK-alt n=1 Tax=unclassified Afipia TaxID=2642050 RepID=UPI000467A4E4|nr:MULTISPECIES: putative entry exclusion protein TrbK-alt [unclassified Afipia]
MITLVRTAVLSLLSLAATGCTIPLRQARDEAPPPASDPLDARLLRCSALGPKAAADDADCQSAWAEARQRILPPPVGK